MTTYEKWIDYVSGALVAFAAVVSFIVGDWLGGMLFTAVLLGQIVNHVQKRQIAELREDLELALKREREFMYRALAAETALAYERYDGTSGELIGRFEGDAE